MSPRKRTSHFSKKGLSCWVGHQHVNTTAMRQHANLLPDASMGDANVQRISGGRHAVVHARAVSIGALVAIRLMEHAYASREGMAPIAISEWNGENLGGVRACHVVLQAHHSFLFGSVLFQNLEMLASLSRWSWTKSTARHDPLDKRKAVPPRCALAFRFHSFLVSTLLQPQQDVTVLAVALHAGPCAYLVTSLSANSDVMQVPLLKCPSALKLEVK